MGLLGARPYGYSCLTGEVFQKGGGVRNRRTGREEKRSGSNFSNLLSGSSTWIEPRHSSPGFPHRFASPDFPPLPKSLCPVCPVCPTRRNLCAATIYVGTPSQNGGYLQCAHCAQNQEDNAPQKSPPPLPHNGFGRSCAIWKPNPKSRRSCEKIDLCSDTTARPRSLNLGTRCRF